MRLQGSLFLTFVLLLLMAQPFLALPSEAQYYTPSISIYALSPSDVDIQTPTTESRTVHFTTTVHVYDPNGIHIDVNLALDDGPEWSTTVVPEYMSFNASGDQKVTITVIVPSGILEGRDVDIRLVGVMTYQGYTKQANSDTAWIYLLQHYLLEVAWHPMKKEQYVNKVELTVTNKGSGPDEFRFQLQNSYLADREHINVNFGDDGNYYYHANTVGQNQSSTTQMTATYSGSSFPKDFVLQVRLTSVGAQEHNVNPSYWDVYILVSFAAPDRTQQNYIFAGVISGAVIMMVVVMAALVFGSGKKKSGKGPDDKDY